MQQDVLMVILVDQRDTRHTSFIISDKMANRVISFSVNEH